jgi:anti-sigma B factor antagonist
MELTIDDGTGTVHVSGDAGLEAAAVLRDRISDLVHAGCTEIVVDLTGVRHVDSSTFGVLVSAVKRLRTSGGHLSLVVDQDDVLRLLRLTRLHHVIAVHPTVEAARDASAGRPRTGSGGPREPGRDRRHPPAVPTARSSDRSGRPR